MIHSFRALVLFLATVALAACVPPKAANTVAVVKHDPVEIYEIALDEKFTPEEEAQIKKSLKEWNEASGGYVGFKVRDKKFNSEGEISYENVQYDEDGCTNFTFLVRTTSETPIIRQIEKEIGTKIGGYTDKQCEMNAVFIVADRMKDMSIFKMVMTHELGHLIGLAHIPVPDRSVMFPGMDHSTKCITELDVAQLCLLYGCDPKKITPVCL